MVKRLKTDEVSDNSPSEESEQSLSSDNEQLSEISENESKAHEIIRRIHQEAQQRINDRYREIPEHVSQRLEELRKIYRDTPDTVKNSMMDVLDICIQEDRGDCYYLFKLLQTLQNSYTEGLEFFARHPEYLLHGELRSLDSDFVVGLGHIYDHDELVGEENMNILTEIYDVDEMFNLYPSFDL